MKLVTGNKDGYLFEVNCATVSIELVDLALLPAHFNIVTFYQVELRDRDGLNELLCFLPS